MVQSNPTARKCTSPASHLLSAIYELTNPALIGLDVTGSLFPLARNYFSGHSLSPVLRGLLDILRACSKMWRANKRVDPLDFQQSVENTLRPTQRSGYGGIAQLVERLVRKDKLQFFQDCSAKIKAVLSEAKSRLALP